MLWERLAEGSTEDELRRSLIERFGIDAEQADADVTSFVADLRGRQLLAP